MLQAQLVASALDGLRAHRHGPCPPLSNQPLCTLVTGNSLLDTRYDSLFAVRA